MSAPAKPFATLDARTDPPPAPEEPGADPQGVPPTTEGMEFAASPSVAPPPAAPDDGPGTEAASPPPGMPVAKDAGRDVPPAGAEPEAAAAPTAAPGTGPAILETAPLAMLAPPETSSLADAAGMEGSAPSPQADPTPPADVPAGEAEFPVRPAPSAPARMAGTSAAEPGLPPAPEPEARPTPLTLAPTLGTPEVPAMPAAAPPALIATLMRRGDALLALGDISGARRFFERAAEAGSADAAVAAGRTHDPAALAALGARGIRPDPEAAAAWYQRAEALRAAEHDAHPQHGAAP